MEPAGKGLLGVNIFFIHQGAVGKQCILWLFEPRQIFLEGSSCRSRPLIRKIACSGKGGPFKAA